MTAALTCPAWSPYLVGAGIGVLSWLAFALAGQPLGITTSFEHTAAMVIDAAAPKADQLEYFGDNAPVIGWQWMLVLGVFIGATISARLGGEHQPGSVPQLWAARFGESPAKRLLAAFLGAALMLFGARLAGGCTSGHGISGNLQLALSSLAFTVTFAIVGALTALAIYGRK
ncbi:MAG: YeeE/YedE thiosulfate transporter family protein [Enhygromyxa sp.]